MQKKALKVIKRNVMPFVIGAIVFGSIGVIIADTISSSNVTYTENNQTTVKGAIDDLYSKASTLVDPAETSFKYWNNNFVGTRFASNNIPTGSGLSGTYDSRTELAGAYSNFSNWPLYIKTIQINGNIQRHLACSWYNNREFCFGPNYWTGTIGVQDQLEGVNTMNKLKADMEDALGITMNSCSSNGLEAYCNNGSSGYACSAYYGGEVRCITGNGACRVLSDGTAYCGW